MGLTSHLSDAYDAFSSYFVFFSFILSLMKMSLMKSLTVMVLGPGLPPVGAFLQSIIFSVLLKNFSSLKFRMLNMITACCRFTHSFKIMRIPQPVITEVVPPCPVQALYSGRGGKIDVMYTHCIEGREPEVFGLWNFSKEGIREVHPYAQVQIRANFVGETFYSHFFNAKEIQIPFLGHISVNRRIQWIDVPRLFGETGIVTAAWTENTFVYGWGTNPTVIPNFPIRRHTTFQSVPINPHAFVCQTNHDHLQGNFVETRQALKRELQTQIL